MTQFATILFFWPVCVVVGFLFFTVTSYILLGLGQAELDDRLFSQTVWEYVATGFAVFVGMVLVTHWA